MRVRLSLRLAQESELAVLRTLWTVPLAAGVKTQPYEKGVRIEIEDETSADGVLIRRAWDLIAPRVTGPLTGFSRLAEWSPEDHGHAELFDTSVGDSPGVVDPRSVGPKARCPSCSLLLPRKIRDGGLRLKTKTNPKLDLFRDEGQWIASARIVERIRALPGVKTEPLADRSDYLRLVQNCWLGRDPLGMLWGDPCATCGGQKGTPLEPTIFGLHRYARKNWDGSSICGGVPSLAQLFVSAELRQILITGVWKFPKGVIEMKPVLLVEPAGS